MIASAGHYLLVSSIVLNLLALIWRGGTNIPFKQIFFYVASILPALAFLALEYAFIISDFTLKTVFFHSSTDLPLIYKIASGWASHESSMLLWLSMLSIVSITLANALKYYPQLKGIMITMASFVQLLFCTFILKTSDPFEILNVQTVQGMGMNPMLQDMAVAIHPPILYTGFVSLFGVFICSLLILQRPTLYNELFLICRKYTLFALAMLTAGIGLGSWWAYRELGWGGFWYFDPVENISLLPWISSIILHHYLIFTIKNGQFIRSSIFFGIFAFLTTLYGFFFIRSGIVSSVHSFAFSPEKGLYIITICLLLTVLSYLLFVIRIGQLPRLSDNQNQSDSYNDRQSQIVQYGNWFWIISLFVLLVAIIYPIYYTTLFDLEIAIDPAYYHKVFVPVFIPILLLAGIAPCCRNINLTRNLLLLIGSITLTLPIIFAKDPGSVITLVIVAAIFLMVSSIDYLFIASKKLTNTPTSRQVAVFLGHFGTGLLAFAICINVVFSSQISFHGAAGVNSSNDDLSATLNDINFAENEVYYRQIAQFNIKDANGNLVTLRPENRLYKIENTISQEADIYSYISHDLYAVITSVKNKIVSAEIYYKPMISFIWFAVLLMSLAFFARLLKKN